MPKKPPEPLTLMEVLKDWDQDERTEMTDVPATTPMEPMTYEHQAYDQARIALGDSNTSVNTLTSLIALMTLEKCARKSVTTAESFKIDVMRREAWEKMPDELVLAINRWAAELVGIDPDTVVTR